MNITLIGADGTDDEFRQWPSQQAMEVCRDVLFVGTEETGIAWLLFNSRLFVWEELTIDGDLTGRQYVSFKIGVMK